MSPLSREAIFAVLSGLTALACDKSATPQAEPLTSSTAATSGAPTASGAPAAAAQEVPAASGKPADKEKSCAPGGCAPGKCGANK
jgi:hypothetical protein